VQRLLGGFAGRVVRTLALTGAMVAVPAAAMATIYTPNPSDLGDLDHHMLYTWKIGDPSLAGKTITSVTLTFTHLYNWDTNANKLYLHLLNTANNGTCGTTLQGCVAQFSDDPTGSTAVTLRDDFTNNFDPDGAGSQPAYHSAPTWPVPGIGTAGHEDTLLTSRSFAALGGNPTSAPGQPNPAGWSYILDGTLSGSQLYTYTFTFDATQRGLLQAYIAAGGDFAIGLDPDCHFFNDGVSLTILTATGGAAVPEPASLALLGTGLVAVARRYRRRKQA
jgi:PEP-CTERM motif